MNKIEKAQKRLRHVYDKRLRKIHVKNFNGLTNNMEYFITYLQFMRDYYILTEDVQVDGKENIKIATLATAIAEYTEYKNCLLKYYQVIDGVVTQLIEGSKDEVLTKYNKERAFHWKYFWQLVLLNMEDWMGANATV